MDRNELKVQALRERLLELEDKNADLRVELTVKMAEAQQVIDELTERINDSEKDKDAVQEDTEETT